MKIHIEDLRFSCIIGILDFERTTPQEVVIDLELEYTYDKTFIDYAEICELIKSTMKEQKFGLIENALETLFTLLEMKYDFIHSLFIKISKPSILPDCNVSVSDIKCYS